MPARTAAPAQAKKAIGTSGRQGQLATLAAPNQVNVANKPTTAASTRLQMVGQQLPKLAARGYASHGRAARALPLGGAALLLAADLVLLLPLLLVGRTPVAAGTPAAAPAAAVAAAAAAALGLPLCLAALLAGQLPATPTMSSASCIAKQLLAELVWQARARPAASPAPASPSAASTEHGD